MRQKKVRVHHRSFHGTNKYEFCEPAFKNIQSVSISSLLNSSCLIGALLQERLIADGSGKTGKMHVPAHVLLSERLQNVYARNNESSLLAN